MTKKIISLFFGYFFALTVSIAWGDNSPEVVFQKWVAASKQGNVEEVLNLSSSRIRKEAAEDMKSEAKRKEVVELIKIMAPDNVKILKSTTSPDQKKSSLFIEALMQDIFTLKGQKPKKQIEKGEIQFVKEGGAWKLDQQCWGTSGRCDNKEEVGAPASFGKKIPLKQGASVKALKTKLDDFTSVKTQGKPFVVSLVFEGSEENPTLNYAVHQSPSFADFYLKVGDAKITPLAMVEDFALSGDPRKKDLKVLEAGTTYSRSKTVKNQDTLSFLFDIPAEAKGPKTFWISFTVAEQKYTFKVEE